MLKKNQMIASLKMLHRAVATTEDPVVCHNRASIINFIEHLKMCVLMEHNQITFRNEVKWSVDDEYVPAEDKKVIDQKKFEVT